MMVKRAMIAPENTMPLIESLISPVEMEITGMKVKIACLEKTSTAMKIELRCAEMQVEAKDKVDKQKSRLLELLDAKVADLQKKNNTLINMLESCISDKQARNSKMIEASNSMERLVIKIEQSDKIKRELKAHNDELRSMLNSIETKGTAIAKIAKEKLVKYRDDNNRMHGELEDFKLKEGKESHEIDLSWKHLNDLGVQVQDQLSAAKVSETPEATAQILIAIDSLNNEIINNITQIRTDTNSTMQKFSASNDKLLTHVSELKKNIGELEGTSKSTLENEAPSALQLNELKVAIASLVKLCAVLEE